MIVDWLGFLCVSLDTVTMKSTLVVTIFLLTEIVWATASPVPGKEVVSGPRIACRNSYTPYCACEDSASGPLLVCTVSTPEDFDGIRSLLSADSYKDYGWVELHMAANLSIPADVLGGKRAAFLDLYYPDRSTPAGVIDVNAFQSTSSYTYRIDFNDCDLTDFSFAFLAPFSALRTLSIYSSSLKTIKDMPSLPTLTTIYLQSTTDLESWYSPSLTPNLGRIDIIASPDLNDGKVDSILTSMTDSYTYQKLNYLYLDNNALTRVPPLAFSFPALISLYLFNNPIVTLTTGSVNNPYDNLRDLYLDQTNLATVEPGAFIGDFSSTRINLGSNAMTTFPSSSFRNLLRSMVDLTGYVDIYGNPISDDCGLAWLLVDNRDLLPYVRNGAIANGTAFEDLNPGEYSSCF